MLNNIELRGAAVEQASYNGVDTIVIMMCKECMAGLDYMKLPASVRDVVAVLAEKKTDLFEAGSIERVSCPVMLMSRKLQQA